MLKKRKNWINWIITRKCQHTLETKALFILLMFIMIIIFSCDYFSGRYITLFFLYFFPIMLATFKIGLKTGIFFSVIACLFGFITELVLKPEAAVTLLVSITLTRMAGLSLLAYGSYKIQLLTNHLQSVSERDFLTRILNRRGFFQQSQIELERMARTHQPMSLIYIDIDNFKEINDLMGHDAGDAVLQKVAAIIKSNIRKIDIFARLGGDEFAILLPSTNSRDAMRISKKLFTTIQSKKLLNHSFVQVSIGVASFITPPNSIAYALKCADNLMYKVKKSNQKGILQDEF